MAVQTKTIKVCGYRSNIGNPQSWWVDTGIFVTSINKLEIDASNFGSPMLPWHHTPAGEVNNTTNRDWPETLANQTGVKPGDNNCWFGSLIGKIGRDGKAFSIGNDKSFTPDISGTLFLGYNDGANFEDNDGYWNVQVKYEQFVRIASDGYGTANVYADRINTSLVDTWGVFLTVQQSVTTSLQWNATAISNLISAFVDIQNRFSQANTNRVFKEVFRGVEIQLTAEDEAGEVFTDNLIRFGTKTMQTTVPRADDRTFGRINPDPAIDYYKTPATNNYGFLNTNDKGVQNTIIHELGHVLGRRAAYATGSKYRLPSAKGINIPAPGAFPYPDASDDIGTFWENSSGDAKENMADHFLNWVRNTYVGIEGDIDSPTAPVTNEQIRASHFWLGLSYEPVPGTTVNSVGIIGFAQGSATDFASSETILRRFGLGENNPGCTF